MKQNLRTLFIAVVVIILVIFGYRYVMNERARKMEMVAQQGAESFCGTGSCALTH